MNPLIPFRPASTGLCGWFLLALTTLTATLGTARGASPPTEAPFLRSELIFEPEHWHNHGSCIVETPRGDLLVCWFHGSGERQADDVRIEGARLRRGSRRWSDRFLLADTPGHPDTNCAFFFGPDGRLWLVWPTILANLWESALLKARITADFEHQGPPRWQEDRVLHIKPGPEFDTAVEQWLPKVALVLDRPDLPANDRKEVERYLAIMRDRGPDKLYRRLGWMTRAHPLVVDGTRILLPLYHDGFSFSLIALSEDGGTTWSTTAPLIGGGNIQPTLARRRDGTLVAHMRDNGPPPARVHQSESADGGRTWSPVQDTTLPNPGAGTDLVALRDGRWLFIGNDTEDGRHRLVILLSEDEGRTWSRKRYLERDEPGPLAGRYHYPSLVQARDGTLHATYSHHASTARPLPKDRDGQPAHSSIKHAHFNLAWVLAGEPSR